MQIKLCAFADESGSSLSEQIKNLLQNKVYSVELRSVDGINVSKLTNEQAREIYEKLSENGIEVWSIGSPLGKIDVEKPFEEHFDMLKRLMEIADILHTKRIRMFSYFVKREDYDKYREVVIDRLNRMTEYAKGYMLCHENESDIFGATVENCQYLLEKVKGLYYVFDSANYVMWDEDISKAVDALHAKTEYFHIKDNIYKTKQIVPSGYGDGLIDQLVARLDRDATFTIEPHLKVFAGYSDVDSKQMNNKFVYDSSEQSFKAAIDAFKKIMIDNGYVEGEKGVWKK